MRYFITIILGLLFGVLVQHMNIDAVSINEVQSSEIITFMTISEGSASCDNMFVGTDHNCNESTANCGSGVGGTGYNLSCRIVCDNDSTVNCGFSSDPEVALLLNNYESCIEMEFPSLVSNFAI